MEREPQPHKPSRLTELREKLGMLAGRRPDWIDEKVWDRASPAELRMIKVMHYRGKVGFTVLRSAETGLKNYSRVRSDD